jgi:hypothetical protein
VQLHRALGDVERAGDHLVAVAAAQALEDLGIL